MSRISRQLWVLGLLVSGCGSDPGPSAIRLEIGTGLDEFIPMEPGGPVDIIAGPQGGYHIWMSVRVWNATCEERALVSLSARLAETDEAVGPRSRVKVGLDPEDGDGARLRAGLFNYIDDPDVVAGRRVTLRVEIEVCAESAEAERTVVPKL